MPTFERGLPQPRAATPAAAPARASAVAVAPAPATPFDNFSAFEPPSPVRVRSRGDAWQRWQMVSLDPRDALKKALESVQLPAEPPPPPSIDFEALHAMREGARKRRLRAGLPQGQTQGYGDGHREGYARGLESARQRSRPPAATLAGNFRVALGRVEYRDWPDALVGLAPRRGRASWSAQTMRDRSRRAAARGARTAGAPSRRCPAAPCLLLNPEDVTLVETHLAGRTGSRPAGPCAPTPP